MAQDSANSDRPDDSRIDVAHLAGLARLAMDNDTANQVANHLGSIMDMIDAMGAVDTKGVEPLSHPMDGGARLRSDTVTETPDPEHFQRNAPATAEHYYLVPRVVE